MGSGQHSESTPLLDSAEAVEAMVAGVAALADPTRRSIFRFVVASPEAVSRKEVADGVGLAEHVAKFHLDKLAEDGLLEFELRRPPGRRGPGAGRPAKHYRRAARELSVSVPERRYEFAGQLLARAIEGAGDARGPVLAGLCQAATEQGRMLGAVVIERAGPGARRSAVEGAIRQVLGEAGYEPRDESHDVVLANCPFHSLAQEHTDLVCGMNLDLLSGLLSRLEHARLAAALDPVPGQCCVKLRRT